MNNPKTLFKWGIPIAGLLFLCTGFVAVAGGLTWLGNRSHAVEPASLGEVSRTSGENPLTDNSPEIKTTLAAPAVQEPLADTPSQVFIPSVTQPIIKNPDTAILQSVNGLVQVQQPDNSWKTIQTAEIKTGQTFRTWDYSSATLHFYDGSTVLVSANTRLTLNSVNAVENGPREIILFQAYGETQHQVASNSAGSYLVDTPSASGKAMGTVFQVNVETDKSSQFSTTEGTVEVTASGKTVQIEAGLTTTVEKNKAPTEPTFWITGQGEVSQTGDVWSIGGLPFQTHEGTIITGDPQIGDMVSVRGRLLSDGTRLADRITLLAPDLVDQFRLTGLVDQIGETRWIVAGQEIQVDEHTDIDEGVEVGSNVVVSGIIREGGALYAQRINLLDETTPFEFTGMVELIEAPIWTISGAAINTDSNTEISGDPVIGDLVKVEGQILPDGTWLADEIKKVSEAERFEFIGTVETIAPWVVSGTPFEVNEFTVIEPGIAVGSLVRVSGRVMPDGTWVATSIELLDSTNTLVFIGIVDSVDPWVVNGITLTVDENTIFTGTIVPTSLVRVEVQIQPDGTWLVLSMELIEVGPVIGCTEFSDIVVAVTAEEITLASGLVIPRAIAEIEGDLQAGSQVMVKLCFNPEEEMVYAWILVLDEVRPTPTPETTPRPTETPAPEEEEKATICHVPPGNKNNAHTITVGASAVPAHLAHGDYLGPCDGNHDNK